MAAERIRALTRSELDLVLDWADEEGWNPGLGDADAFWAADPEGFLGVERDGELIGCGSVVSYGGRLGAMGLFMIRPHARGNGVGGRLWRHRRDHLLSRLRPGAPIGMDGVVEMRDFYERGGFRASHETVRFVCEAPPERPDPGLVPLAEVPFDRVEAIDRERFGAPRTAFLRRWIEPAGGLALALRDGGDVRGLGVARPARSGFKAGPVFAEDADAAERILGGLAALGGPLTLDVPDANRAAPALAERLGGAEEFRCARMYHGEPPPIDWSRVFATTTLELG